MKSSFSSIIISTIQDIRRNLFSSGATVGVIALGVLIFSAFSLIAYNLACLLTTWENKIEMVVYLKGETPAVEIKALLSKIEQIAGVESVRYVSPSDAMTFMKDRLGSQKNLLEGVESSLLPPSLEVKPTKGYRNSTGVEEIISRLKQFSQVQEIQYGREWIDMLSSLVHIFRFTQWALGGILLLAIAFIILSTLRLAISSRQEEIEAMKWVGASPSFIRIPIYLEGIVQGLIGAGLALLLVFLAQKIVLHYVPSSMPPSMKDWLEKIPILFLPLKIVLGILSGGMILGFFGSLMAIEKLLKPVGVRERKAPARGRPNRRAASCLHETEQITS